MNERRKVEGIPVKELNHLFGHFVSLWKSNGDEYEPSSLSTFQPERYICV